MRIMKQSPYVKWQDEQQGWHTGHLVLNPAGCHVSYSEGVGFDIKVFKLVRESCDGRLSWVHERKLSKADMHSEIVRSHVYSDPDFQPPPAERMFGRPDDIIGGGYGGSRLG